MLKYKKHKKPQKHAVVSPFKIGRNLGTSRSGLRPGSGTLAKKATKKGVAPEGVVNPTTLDSVKRSRLPCARGSPWRNPTGGVGPNLALIHTPAAGCINLMDSTSLPARNLTEGPRRISDRPAHITLMRREKNNIKIK